jgi:hypothetical protein
MSVAIARCTFDVTGTTWNVRGICATMSSAVTTIADLLDLN